MSEQPKYGFWPYVLPFLAFMVISMAEPGFPAEQDDVLADVVAGAAETADSSDEYVQRERRQRTQRFFLVYGFKVLVTTGFLVWFWKRYLGQFPWSFTWWSILVGVIGIFVWVGLAELGVEDFLLGLVGAGDTFSRSQFNPYGQLPEGWQLTGFLALRFFGLVIMVPICEELFLRGFLMRYAQSPEWWEVRLNQLTVRTMLVAPLYGLLTHPGEALAAIAWFSLVTWLVTRTGKFWDAVIAHAVTNLLLGLYVCRFEQWHLW
ncbi:MAG: CAAX prenyl protease-related protein [Pirellulaceae bacterium]